MTFPDFPSLPLEDQLEDIVGKAQRGIGLDDATIASRAGISLQALRSIKNGKADEKALRCLAAVLNLGADALIASARKEWYPDFPARMEGLAMINTRYGDMAVNAYLVADKESGEALVFDSGAESAMLLELIRKNNLKALAILLTHTHADHVADLDRLRNETGAKAFVSSREAISWPWAGKFDEGKTFEAGSLRVETRLTWGHSRGGITYFVTGLARPVAIVGDAMFAGSMGGGMVSWEAAIKTNREKILTLPDETLLCPGHGPLTTVAQEKQHNPFFAG